MYLLNKITTIITIQKLIPSIGRKYNNTIINIINAMIDISLGNSIVSLPNNIHQFFIYSI
jgi:hypothetical protein